MLALVLLLGACRRAGEKADADADADASANADADANAEEAGADAGPRARDADDDEAYLNGAPRAARSIGHTSVVFKVELTTGKKAVFKPASRRGPTRYKGEIAARRLGVALGLENVPRAFFRAMDAKAMGTAAAGGAPPAGELFTKEAIITGDVVKGALMPWIDGLGFLPLEREPLASQWKAWLKNGASIPGEQQELARQISTLVAFDLVTGNWDRWSGGNVGLDKASGMLLFIDNDGAFFDTPPEGALQKNKTRVEAIDRFSRSFVTRMRALDDAALTRAIGEEVEGVPLLSAKALAGVLRRRRQLLQIVDAKIAAASDERVLAFP